MIQKRFAFFLFAPAIFLVAGVFAIFALNLPYLNSLQKNVFLGHLYFQACPPNSNNPNCPTNTPKPQPTNTPRPQPTDTPKPQPTDTPKSQPTDTPKVIQVTNSGVIASATTENNRHKKTPTPTFIFRTKTFTATVLNNMVNTPAVGANNVDMNTPFSQDEKTPAPKDTNMPQTGIDTIDKDEFYIAVAGGVILFFILIIVIPSRRKRGRKDL